MLHHQQQIQLSCVQAKSLNQGFAKIKLDTNQQSEAADFFDDTNSRKRLLQAVPKHLTGFNDVGAKVVSIFTFQRIQD